MRIAKYPFAVLSAALFTVMLMTPISSLSNLIWLASVDMPVGLISSLEVILFDFQRLGNCLVWSNNHWFYSCFHYSWIDFKIQQFGR
jgi:hypothetical protein